MAFRLEFSAEAERDFGLIFDHLLNSYIDFGEGPESALDHAGTRVLEIRVAAERIFVRAPSGRAPRRHPARLAASCHRTSDLLV